MRNILFGPPGTGKTTQLISIVEEALNQGTHPSRIAVCSFTKKAAEEFATRAEEKFSIPRKDFPHFRTLHSMAFRSLGIRKTEVMATEHFTEFGNTVGGFDFTHQYDEMVERPPLGGGLGDKCLTYYALAKAKRRTLEDIWSKHADTDVDLETLKHFSTALDKYKERNYLFDFTDFLDKSSLVLDVDLFILDEAQDLTQQQWAFANKAASKATQLWVAGDDDQSIFEFSGADAEALINLEGNRHVLPVSYRVPRQIYAVANRLVEQIQNRVTKVWSPRDDEGRVEYVRGLDDCDLMTGSWLLLARHQYQLIELEHEVKESGHPYIYNNKSSLDTPYIRAVRHYEAFRKGSPLGYGVVELISRYISKWKPDIFAGTKTWDELRLGDKDLPWMEAFDLLGQDDREYLRAVLRNGYKLTDTPRILINTIHSVKGGEADNVFLLPDMSRKAYDNFNFERDSELRVWYVAVTRARHALYIAEPRTNRYIEL